MLAGKLTHQPGITTDVAALAIKLNWRLPNHALSVVASTRRIEATSSIVGSAVCAPIARIEHAATALANVSAFGHSQRKATAYAIAPAKASPAPVVSTTSTS